MSLNGLPIELLFRIFDHLDRTEILLSVRHVNSRLNAIIDAYHPYQVNRLINEFDFRLNRSLDGEGVSD